MHMSALDKGVVMEKPHCEKKTVRKRMRKMRKQMSVTEHMEKSNQICERVEKFISEKKLRSIMVFVSMKNEVNTHSLVDRLIDYDKIVLAPVMDEVTKELLPYRLSDSKNELVQNDYGIYEPHPQVCKPFPIGQIELVLVPGLAFDRKGYRVGYGGGYYDRFLKKCTQAVWLGLAYENQLVDYIPHEKWDVPVNMIATEKRMIDCQNSEQF